MRESTSLALQASGESTRFVVLTYTQNREILAGGLQSVQ